MSGALYNEIDPFASQWLRNLADAGRVEQGIVDTRSIKDLKPSDCRERSHFFAGIGGWSHALRLAGISDGVPLWTGSCPCQPFSQAGRGLGFDDERHLWPDWFKLICECRPPVVFGEQVASKDGLAWLDLVSADMEGSGYAFGAAILPAAGVGAPHQRHRIFFVAVASGERLEGVGLQLRQRRPFEAVHEAWRGCEPGAMADADIGACRQRRSLGGRSNPRGDAESWAGLGGGELAGGVAFSDARRLQIGRAKDGSRTDGGRCGESKPERVSATAAESSAAGAVNGFWSDAEWILCRDGKQRPAQPGSFPLAHGLPLGMGRLDSGQRGLAAMAGLDAKSLKRAKANCSGRLKGYGNAIVPEVAAEFIRAAMEAIP